MSANVKSSSQRIVTDQIGFDENNHSDSKEEDEKTQEISLTISIDVVNNNNDEILINTNNTSSSNNGKKKIVKLISNEGEEFLLEDNVVEMCKTVKSIASGKKGFRNGLGGWFNIEGKYVLHKKEGRLLATINSNSENETILCFPEIRSNILHTVLEYCKFHSSSPSFNQVIDFDGELISSKQNNLCELASASYYLDVKSLVCLTSKEIAAQISQKSSDEIKETFSHLQLAGYNQFFTPTLKTKKPSISSKKSIDFLELNNQSTINTTIDDNRTLDELLQFLGEKKSSSSSSSSSSKKKSNKNNKNNNNVNNTNKKKNQKKKNSQRNINKSNESNEEQKDQKLLQQEQQQKEIKLEIINKEIEESEEIEEEYDEDENSFNSGINSSNNGSIEILDNNNNNNNIHYSFSSNNSSFDEDNEYEIDQEDYIINEDEDNQMEEINPDLQDEIDKEVEDFKTRLDLFNNRPLKPKLKLPSDTLAALLDVC